MISSCTALLKCPSLLLVVCRRINFKIKITAEFFLTKYDSAVVMVEIWEPVKTENLNLDVFGLGNTHPRCIVPLSCESVTKPSRHLAYRTSDLYSVQLCFI